jgi:hypothetical protein
MESVLYFPPQELSIAPYPLCAATQECRMVLRYCRLHGRRWSFTQQCWIPFPQESFQALEAYAARLRAIAPEAYSLTLMDTSCDACPAPLQPRAPTYGAPNGLRLGEHG